MKFSDNGKSILTKLEGIKNKIYSDIVGYATIGIGHLLTQSELSSGKIKIKNNLVKYSIGLTDQQVYDLLDTDIEKYEQVVNDTIKVKLTQNQFDSLIIFSFNIGIDGFKNSTLVKLLNQEQYEEVPKQLARWIYAGGKVVEGLKNRRNEEIKLWLSN